LKRGQIVLLTVKAPQSGEVFRVPLELEDDGMGSYSNLSNSETEAMKEAARVEIRRAVEKLKTPANYGASQGYSNIAAHEWGIGGSNPAVSKAQKDAGLI
jgi:hypothetical protein